MFIIEIPAIENLTAVDQCSFVKASWNITETPCKNFLYNVTLIHSNHTVSHITNSTTFNFTNTSELNGDRRVYVFAFNGNAKGKNDSDIAVDKVPPTG